MRRKYTEEMKEWIRENYAVLDTTELTVRFNDRFGTDATPKAIKSYKMNHGLTGAPRVRIYSALFPEEVCRFIGENYKGTGHVQMALMIKGKFGRDYTAQQIKSYYGNHGLDSGLSGRFEKGSVPHNRGVKMSPEVYEKAKGTMFKKGHRPYNAQEVGTEIIDGDGYHKIKVAEPRKWEFKHRLIWQQEHGEIPEGMIVGFKDGNKDNLSTDNLCLISREENLEMTRRGLRSGNAELTETGIAVAKLNVAVRNVRKGRAF